MSIARPGRLTDPFNCPHSGKRVALIQAAPALIEALVAGDRNNPYVFNCFISLAVGTAPAYFLAGGKMLRAEMQDSEKASVIRLQGRLAGADAEHVRMLVTHRNIETRLLVDLTEITFIDPVGEATLSFLGGLGAKFVAEDVYLLDVCKRLQLPLARNGKGKP